MPQSSHADRIFYPKTHDHHYPQTFLSLDDLYIIFFTFITLLFLDILYIVFIPFAFLR